MRNAIKTYIEYHVDMTHRVWGVIDHITDEQFLADDVFSRGSIRKLMIHLASTDRRWLAGLKDQPDVSHLNFDEYPTRSAARAVFETVVNELTEYVLNVSDEDLMQSANGIPAPRWAVLLHIVNHGTDHRSTVLQRLTELGAPTFDQDFILWLWSKK